MEGRVNDGPLSPAVDLQRNKNTFGCSKGVLPEFGTLSLYSPGQVQSSFEDDVCKKVFQQPNDNKIASSVPTSTVLPENQPVDAAEYVDKVVPTVVKQTFKEESCDKKFTTEVISDTSGDFISLKTALPKFECKIGEGGKIVPGNCQTLKRFTEALPAYKFGIDKACENGITQTENLVVNVRDKKAVDIALGDDCIKGIHLTKQVKIFDTKGLKLVVPLGEGKYGKVALHEDHINKRRWAVKSVQLDSRSFNPYEAEVLALAATHPGGQNVISAHAFYIAQRNMHFAMDVAGQTLENHMWDISRKVDERLLKSVLKQCLGGLKFLNIHGFIHLDLKPQNIAIDNRQNVKLLDLGSCSKIGEESDKAGLTPKYVAKEVAEPYLRRWQGIEADPVLSPKADIYSLGCCLIALAKRQHVWDQLQFPVDQYIQGLEYIFSNESELHRHIPVNYGQGFVDLMTQMTRYDHQCRCGIEEIFKHPFVSDKPPVYTNTACGGERVTFDPCNPASLQALQNIASSGMQMRQINLPTFVEDRKIKVEPEPPKRCSYQMQMKAELMTLPACQGPVKPVMTQTAFQEPKKPMMTQTAFQEPVKPEVVPQSSCAMTANAAAPGNPIYLYCQTPADIGPMLKAAFMYQAQTGQNMTLNPDLGNQKRTGPVPVADNDMDTATQGTTIPVPVFEEIMSEKNKRAYLQNDEEEINLRGKAVTCVENLPVPVFNDLLTDANDYSQREPPKTSRRSVRQSIQVAPPAPRTGPEMIPIPTTTQFKSDNQVPLTALDMVDLSLRRQANHGGKRSQKRSGKPYQRRGSKHMN